MNPLWWMVGERVVRDLEAFRDQVFYTEAVRLREEQRQRLGVGGKADSSNVVSFEQYRQRLGVSRDRPSSGNPQDRDRR